MAGLIGAGTAAAQTPPSIVSTIGPPESAASRIDRVLATLAEDRKDQGWTYQSSPCSGLADVLGAPGPVAILTTPDCLKRLPGIEATTISGNVGFPAYFFTRDSATILQNDATIGIVSSDDPFRFRVRGALKTLWDLDVNVDATSRDYNELLAGLGDRFDAICVIDAHSGMGLARVLELTQASGSGARLAAEPLSLPTAVRPAQDEPLALRDMTPLGLRGRLVDPPLGLPPGTGPASETVVAFAAGPTEAAAAPDALHSVFAAFMPETVLLAAGPVRNPRPLPAVSPILLTRGEVPAAVGEAVRHALLAAPVDALINPCEPTAHQDMYRSFLRGAIGAAGDDELVLAALWEHAALQKSRGQRDKDTYEREKDHISRLLSDDRREALVRAFSEARGDQACNAGMRALFRGKKLAYYQRGIERLRDALATPAIDTAADAFTEAAACLRKAFKERRGKDPSCRESVLGMGMFTTYYAPYLPMAVIGTEDHRAPGR